MRYQFTNSVPYLINRAGVGVGAQFSDRIRVYGITLPMYRVLAALRQTGQKTLGDLSDMVSKEQSTLSRLIGKMEAKGLVTRDRPKDNARIVLIDLTPKGETLADELMPIAIHFEQTLTEGLDEAQIDALKAMLTHVYTKLSEL
ncbi:MarR family winged helix-turn-helix transcriptional regulator [Amorphus sp. 3PC139-8]|uniref:MarR family winged helix-turn-helix transcriptional regulator n=1 Tax=Amorphus sp. 3PC139-8 TaxID=2735676 RepID=UPI00345D0CE5